MKIAWPTDDGCKQSCAPESNLREELIRGSTLEPEEPILQSDVNFHAILETRLNVIDGGPRSVHWAQQVQIMQLVQKIACSNGSDA